MGDIDRLVYRRQYVLAPEEIICPFRHQTIRVSDNYTLYAHSDLVVSEYSSETKRLLCLGDIFDYENSSKDNIGILKDISVASLDSIPQMTDKFTGRFVIIIVEKERIVLVHDSIAYKIIYYSSQKNKLWFCSHPHLLAKILNLNPTENNSKLEFYNSSDFIRLSNSNLGDSTYFDDIKQLMPNHYFDVTANRIVRFWPSQKIERLSLEEATQRCSVMVKGYMESIYKRYKLMLPVTSGYDSRLLMAATKDYRSDVFYYINKAANQSKEGRDIRIPDELFKSLGMEFNHVILPKKIDSTFEKIYFENNPLASKEFLPHVFNYYQNFSDRINLPGNISSTPFGINNLREQTVSMDKINRYYGIQQYSYARDYFEKWMAECHELCRAVGLNVMNLYYWEEKMPNWGAQIALDKDIAQDEISPFNSRLLIETIFSVPLKYRNIPDKILHRKIIQNLWPDLLNVSFNPSRKNTLFMLLAQLGLFNITSRISYRFSKK
jgi:hypothetical protein